MYNYTGSINLKFTLLKIIWQTQNEKYVCHFCFCQKVCFFFVFVLEYMIQFALINENMINIK